MRRTLAIVALSLAVCLALGSCRPADPRTEVLEQRARFTVELLSWVARDDGTISVSVRVAGPPSTSLERLTFRISQFDAAQQTLANAWRTIELSELPRGGPRDMLFSVPSAGDNVEGLAATLILNPTPEEAREIVELQGL